MAQRLRDGLVLLTGASSGIGRAASSAFVRTGARVIGVARSQERLHELAAELGDRFLPLVADVADPDSMEAMASTVLGEIGLPGVIVANAGIGLDARFAATRDDGLRRVLEVNVLGVVRTIRPFVDRMAARGAGRILFVSSIVGKRGTPHYAAYSTSKFALDGLADALAAELHSCGVRVGVVYPSSTDTGFQDRLLREGPSRKRVRPRTHSAESVAEAIVSMATSARRGRILGVEAKLLALADAVAPRLVDHLLGRMLVARR